MEQSLENPSILVSRDEACRLLGGIDLVTLWRMVKRGDLKQVNIGSRAFIVRSSIDDFVSGQSAT